MAPPGRRRQNASVISLLMLTLLFLSHTASAASAVLGIDLGTEYIKAVLVKPGTPLEIVLAKDSKRKEPVMVAFKTPKANAITAGNFPERSYGSAAQALSARYPWDAYPNLKQLLGLPIDTSSVVKEYKARYPALDVVKADPRGTVAFQSRSFPKEAQPFAVEEILAMELKNIIANAQTMAGKAHKVKSVVFTIPPFYTIEEKSALEQASELAGIGLLGTVSDGLAVGINYATSRTFESINDGAKPELHMVFDVGAGYTTATILKMQGRTVKDVGKFNKTIQEVIVAGTGWDRTLGGDALNTIIVKDIATKFVESDAGKKLGKTATDVLSNGRTSARLWKDAEKIRQVLSANQQTSGSWEELYEDVDFRYKLTRADFEAQSQAFAERLEAPFKNALKAANLTVAELDSVILHGGAIRTPFIQKKLEELAGGSSKLRSNVNSDESAAFGAAFKAASISPSFRVKDIRGYDAAIYPTWIQYKKEKDGKTTQQKIFTPSSHVGAKKVITFAHQDDFEIYMFQKRPTDAGSPFESGNADNSGSRFLSKNLTLSITKLVKDFGCKPEDITTQVTLSLEPFMGLPEVVGGTISCDHEVPEEKAGVKDKVKDFLGFGKKEEGSQKVLKDDKKKSSSSATEESSTSSSKTTASKSSASKDAKASKEVKDAKAEKDGDKTPKMKIKTETVKLEFVPVHDQSASVPFVEQKFKKERIRSFDASDKTRVAREEDLNTLEAFVYKARDYLEDELFAQYASKPVLKEIEDLIKSTASWLSDNGGTAVSETLKEKLKGLKALVDPVRERKEEASKRPENTEILRDGLKQAKSLLKLIEDSIEAAKSASTISSASSTTESSASSSNTASSADPLADLEQEESSITSAVSSESATPSPEPVVSPYTEEELKKLKDTYDEVEQWFEKKLAEQEKLKPWEEPVFKAGELITKGTELNDKIMKLLQEKLSKQRRAETKKNKNSSKKPKTKAEEKIKDAKSKVDEKASSVKAAASSASETVKSQASKATEKAKEAAGSMTENIKQAAETVKEKAQKTKDEL